MGRGKRALAAVAILATLVAASVAAAPRAAAEGGELRGDLPVAGGFALVSWSGGPAEALAEAARSRGCNMDAVYSNAPGGGIVGYFPAAQVAAANREFLAAYSGGLPARSPVYVVCGEPVLPRLVFLGDVSEERRAAIRDEVASVVRFYAERFGAVVPESTLYVSSDIDATAAVYLELTGREYSGPYGVTATPEAGILAFIGSGGLERDTATFDELLAHEYYHMLQYGILRSGGLHTPAAPQWLTEGTAAYGAHLYRATLVHGDCQGCLDQDHLDPNPGWKSDLLHSNFNHLHYDSWAAAIARAVDRSGDPRSHLEYWRALTRTRDWSAAFRTAFGMTSDEFLDSIERYRLSLLDDAPRIRVMVFADATGAPIEGVRVVVRQHPSLYVVARYTNSSGEIEIPLLNGSYRVLLDMRICDGYDDVLSDQDIVVSDQDVDIVVRVSFGLTELWTETVIDGVSRGPVGGLWYC